MYGPPPFKHTLMDIARILTAAHLGLCATAILLLSAALRFASSGPRRALAPGAFFALSTAATVAALLRGDARKVTALDGAPLLLVLVGALATRPARELLRALPLAALLTTPALRLAGVDALAASRGGWLPAGYANAAAVIEGLCGLGALVATFAAMRLGDKASRALQGWSAASLAGALATAALAWQSVRPLPTFEGLYLAAFLPLCAAMHAAAIVALRAR